MFIAHEKYAHTHPMEVSKNKSILLTNTRPLTSREKAFWARCGYVVHHQALLSVQFLPVNQLDVDPQAIVLTSANGALALEHSDWDRSIPVYGVGVATVTTAKSIGFRKCSSPSDKPYPSALNLINWIKNNLDPQDGVIVFGCGEYLRHDIAEELSKFGFQMLKILLYKTEPVENFDTEITQSLKNGNIESEVFIKNNQMDGMLKKYYEDGSLDTVKCQLPYKECLKLSHYTVHILFIKI